MNCPVCDRLLAPTLSICPACGAMMNDTVREELQSKITMGARSHIGLQPAPSIAKPTAKPASDAAVVARTTSRTVTAGLVAPKTSQTLVDFQNKQTALPDWRLQLQNAVRQRKGLSDMSSAVEQPLSIAVPTAAAAPAEQAMKVQPSDPRVAKAVERMNASRAKFTEEAVRPRKPQPPVMRAAATSLKFGVVSTTGTAAAPALSRVEPAARPKLVVPPPTAKRITSKLPPVASVVTAPPEIEEPQKIAKPEVPFEAAEIDRIRINVSQDAVAAEAPGSYEDDIDDLAPYSMRFGAGLFDLIIGAFIAMVVTSPFILAGGDWSTSGGVLLFVGVWAIVLFLYMTACVGIVGKTLGMRLFSLELVDAFENEYPTLQQAAINSAVYLITLPLAGAGFVTMFYNEENRALHDLLSGTIQVREF